MEYNLTKGIIMRFIRGLVSGAVSAMILIAPMGVSSWGDVYGWLNSLAMAGLLGAISGALLAVDKYLRAE